MTQFTIHDHDILCTELLILNNLDWSDEFILVGTYYEDTLYEYYHDYWHRYSQGNYVLDIDEEIIPLSWWVNGFEIEFSFDNEDDDDYGPNRLTCKLAHLFL